MKFTEALDRRLAIVAAAAIGMIGYTYLTPPLSDASFLTGLRVFSNLSRDTVIYVQRFACSFLLLGLLPFGAARLCGYRLRQLGWQRGKPRVPFRWLLAITAAGAVSGWLSSLSPELASYYPYMTDLSARVAEGGILPFMAHAGGYFLFYYLPWEMLFRGVLIFPFIGGGKELPDSRLLLIASLQAIPSALLHFGHPVSETISAVFFGFAAAYVVVKTRSVLPVLFFHAAVGIGLDAAIVFRGA